MLQVAQTGAQQLQVLIGVLGRQRLASHNFRTAAVHFQRAYGSNQHNHLRDQAGVAALDAEELLHADVSAKTGFVTT